MKQLLITLSLSLLAPFSFGQQIAQYSQWSFNQFAINPALAGVKRCLDVRTAYRAQWLGFEGAPQSGLFTINAPLSKRRKRYNSSFHGLGAKIEQDQFGSFNNLALTLSYALHFPIGRDKRLSFGLSGGVQQFGFDQNQASTIDPDLAIAQTANNTLFPLIGFGSWFNTDTYYIGAAVDQIARNEWGDDIGIAARFRLHTKIQAGTKIALDKKNSLLPGILMRIPPAGPMSIDLNLMVDFNNQFMLGIGYRTTDAIIGFFKVNIKKFSIGYSYDFITSAIRGGNFHTHELSLHYSGCRKARRSKNACPLFE